MSSNDIFTDLVKKILKSLFEAINLNKAHTNSLSLDIESEIEELFDYDGLGISNENIFIDLFVNVKDVKILIERWQFNKNEL